MIRKWVVAHRELLKREREGEKEREREKERESRGIIRVKLYGTSGPNQMQDLSRERKNREEWLRDFFP